MAKKKCQCDAGIPEWVVTYGDMMSLLLTFFILLAAFSELKKEDEYEKVVTAVKEAFGSTGGIGIMPSKDMPLRSMIQTLEEMAKKSFDQSNVSQSSAKGAAGSEVKVTRVQDGMMFTLGGSLGFEPGSAELLPGAREPLMEISRLLRGRENKVEIRGHAATKTLPENSPFKDLWDLSYARAKAVKDFLVVEGGLRKEVMEVVAVADTEPVAPRTYSPQAQAQNRRVEIIMTEALVDDLSPDANFSDPGRALGQTP